MSIHPRLFRGWGNRFAARTVSPDHFAASHAQEFNRWPSRLRVLRALPVAVSGQHADDVPLDILRLSQPTALSAPAKPVAPGAAFFVEPAPDPTKSMERFRFILIIWEAVNCFPERLRQVRTPSLTQRCTIRPPRAAVFNRRQQPPLSEESHDDCRNHKTSGEQRDAIHPVRSKSSAFDRKAWAAHSE